MYNESLKQIQMKEQNIIEIDSSEIFMVKEYQEEEEDNIKFDEEGQLVYICIQYVVTYERYRNKGCYIMVKIIFCYIFFFGL